MEAMFERCFDVIVDLKRWLMMEKPVENKS